MGATVAVNSGHDTSKGFGKPFEISYGKMMMWFFILSDALTFSGFIVAYGFSRFKFIEEWPIADEVFNHFPFLHGVDAPMLYVALMTFVLIASSVTMVLAVDAGHHMKKNKVITYMFLTIIGGVIFVGSQAWEWKNFIAGGYGAVTTKSGKLLQFTDADGHRVRMNTFVVATAADRTQHVIDKGLWFEKEDALPPYAMKDVVSSFAVNPNLRVRTQQLTEAGEKTVLSRAESITMLNKGVRSVEGANLRENEYGHPLFADFFFFITGFHGFHVLTGILINIIIFINVVLGVYERRGQYEMVEKVGLYWHFVDLVWVFVFTFFYLV
ncbi:MAG: cytochrome oxidase subunit III [Kordia sp.]|nr:MAG: cytochrome oxidase subunit III [Kordia sp.]